MICVEHFQMQSQLILGIQSSLSDSLKVRTTVLHGFQNHWHSQLWNSQWGHGPQGGVAEWCWRWGSGEVVVHTEREWGRGQQDMVCKEWAWHSGWCGQSRWKGLGGSAELPWQCIQGLMALPYSSVPLGGQKRMDLNNKRCLFGLFTFLKQLKVVVTCWLSSLMFGLIL